MVGKSLKMRFETFARRNFPEATVLKFLFKELLDPQT